jgi:hypothetical protein
MLALALASISKAGKTLCIGEGFGTRSESVAVVFETLPILYKENQFGIISHVMTARTNSQFNVFRDEEEKKRRCGGRKLELDSSELLLKNDEKQSIVSHMMESWYRLIPFVSVNILVMYIKAKQLPIIQFAVFVTVF